jgi:hypothetical protein
VTTKQELAEGMRMIVREAKRVTSTFTDDDWKKPVHGDEGWNRKQVYCHIAATAEIAPAFLGNVGNAAEGQDAGAGLDIDAFNAQMVAAKEALAPAELMQAIADGHEKLIEFVQNLPDEQLAQKRKFLAVEGTVSDVIDSVLVLHALAHIYSAGASATGP